MQRYPNNTNSIFINQLMKNIMNTNTKNKSMQMYNECKAIYSKLYKNYKSFFDALKKEMVITEKWIDCGESYYEFDDGRDCELYFRFTVPEANRYDYFLDCDVARFVANEEGDLSELDLCTAKGSGYEEEVNIELSNPRYFYGLSSVLYTYAIIAEKNGHKKLSKMAFRKCDKLIQEYEEKYDEFGRYCKDLLETYLKSNDYFSPTNDITIATDSFYNVYTPPIYIREIYEKRNQIMIEGGGQIKAFGITPVYWSLEDILTLSSELEEKLS